MVRAVRDALPSTQEQPFVEWKREGDIANKRWSAEVAKQILGMANRDPDAAAAWFGGCAYVLVGVAPGVLNGSPVHDSAKIESWLAPYVGRTPDGPEWISTYVAVEGRHVLVLAVEPPRWGDRIWTCHKTYSPDPTLPGYDPGVTLRNGAIYVRHKASTEEHTASDLEMLQRRLLGNRRRIAGISVLLTEDSHAVAVDARPDTVNKWAARVRQGLKPPPPPESESRTIDFDELRASGSLRAAAEMMENVQRSMLDALSAASINYQADERTREEYEREVDTYIGDATKVIPGLVLRRMFDRQMGRVTFVVRNDTEDPIHELQLRIHIPAERVRAFDYGDLPEVELPRRPPMLGKRGRYLFGGLEAGVLSSLRVPDYGHLSRSILPAIGRGVRIDNSGSVTLTFDPVDLLPRDTIDLPEVQLFTSIDYAGTLLDASGLRAHCARAVCSQGQSPFP